MKISPRLAKVIKKKGDKDDTDDQHNNDLNRTTSTSSYMQQRRHIYVNMNLPASEYDEKGRQINHQYATNLVQTAKYTPINFIPKNLFEQFRNVANLYFLFLVILQCIPLFGVTEPAVSALPLIAILIITAIKDAIEDWKRSKSDDVVNNSTVLTLSNWKNVNIPEIHRGSWYFLQVMLGYFSVLSGTENKYAIYYRQSKKTNLASSENDPAQPPIKSSEDRLPLTELQQNEYQPPASPSKTLLSSVRKRSNTIRSSVSGMFQRSNPHLPTPEDPKPYYRPGAIPHSVLYRSTTRESQPVNDSPRPSSSIHQNKATNCSTALPGDPPSPNCNVDWNPIKWKDLQVGDYVLLKNDESIPADIVILSTSETDNICYIETQNLDGETNLKQRQGLPGTRDIQTEHDCERAKFYIESEPPHVNIYQYNGVLRWQIDADETNTIRSGVAHEKADAVTYNNILLRGCILRNTQWAIGVVVYSGKETKIMLNTGRTPSKRSKIAKATNPHVKTLDINRFVY